jgi:hypothetical protein
MKASAKGYNSESDIKGKPAPVDGLYHVTISHVNDTRTKKDGSALNATTVEFEVLAGTVPGQEGKVVTQWYNLDDSGHETAEYGEKVSRLCMAAGLLKPGEEKDIDASDLQGCQVVIKAANYKKRDGRTGCGIADYGLAIWSITHPEVASVPKNLDAVRLWREATGQLVGGGNGQAGNGRSPAAPMTSGTASAVSADDI